VLIADDPELHDLARRRSAVLDDAGTDTGIRLERWLGAGGMGVVFEARLEGGSRYPGLSPDAPARLALKVLRPAVQREAAQKNLDPDMFFERERLALARMMARQPPTEFVLAFHGSGQLRVVVERQRRVLPFLAVDLVEGGIDGVTLTERVLRQGEQGVDPVRALRLLRGVFEGLQALHKERIIHRDLKPDNVLVAGPIDDEIPKISDCGIARVSGLLSTVAAMTPAYCGPEQCLSLAGESNPLIGPWSDVHALSVLAWFVLGGEHWCRSDGDQAWQRGERRNLRSAAHLHVAFASRRALLERLNEVLRMGAAPRPPDLAFEQPGAVFYERSASLLTPDLFDGSARLASVAELSNRLLPLLEESAHAWRARASRDDRAATASRLTLEALGLGPTERESLAREVELGTKIRRLIGESATVRIEPGSVVFLPDDKRLLKIGPRLLYFVGDRPHSVAVPADLADTVAQSRWLVRGPGRGFALVGTSHVLFIRGTEFVGLPLPVRASGGGVGEIQAVVEGGDLFGIVTAETEEANGGPELWLTINGTDWETPILLPLGGDPLAIAHGPYGFLVTGARGGRYARALFQPFGMHAMVYSTGVNKHPPLRRALAGATREMWAAAKGIVLSLERGSVSEERVDDDGEPVAMALDLVGVPWLVTETAVLRRHVQSGAAAWKEYYRRAPGRARLVAIGFSREGACVVDEDANGVRISSVSTGGGA
jgi:serine/threonine protein kinase